MLNNTIVSVSIIITKGTMTLNRHWIKQSCYQKWSTSHKCTLRVSNFKPKPCNFEILKRKWWSFTGFKGELKKKKKSSRKNRDGNWQTNAPHFIGLMRRGIVERCERRDAMKGCSRWVLGFLNGNGTTWSLTPEHTRDTCVPDRGG